MSTLTARSPHDAAFAGSRGIELVRGEGAFVFDREGRRYFDATSQYGVTSIGHAHPRWVAAVSEQAQRLGSCFASFGNPVRDGLLARLAEWMAPLDRFFLCNSGTEAMEAALKHARKVTGRHGVLALTHGFHGRTLGALGATWRPSHRDGFAPLLGGMRHVRPGDLDALESSLDDDVGLVVVEVVQGEGGVRPIDGAYLRQARSLARERGALFAVDEVQTGIGRTGRFCAHEHHALDPDLVCLAKGLASGLPIGALAWRAERGSMGPGDHGSTFGGNPLSAAAACATLDLLREEDLLLAAAANGERLRAQLEQGLAGVDGVRAVRGLGLMLGIELRQSSVGVQRALQERGYLVLGAGPRVLRLLPPLVSTAADLEQLGAAVIEELKR